MFTVNYFIDKFNAIPEDQWCINHQLDTKGRRCALGHANEGSWAEGTALQNLFLKHKIYYPKSYTCSGAIYHGVAAVNNGIHPAYKQSTPKQRILRALYNIKKAEYPEITNPPIYIDDFIKEEIVA